MPVNTLPDAGYFLTAKNPAYMLRGFLLIWPPQQKVTPGKGDAGGYR